MLENQIELYIHGKKIPRLRDLQPIDKMFYYSIDKRKWKASSDEIYLFEHWVEYVRQLGYEPNRIKAYKQSKEQYAYYYEGDYLTVELYNVDPAWLAIDETKKLVDSTKKARNRFLERNLFVYFTPALNLFVLDYFCKFYYKIDKDYLFEIFMNLSAYYNYKLLVLPKQTLRTILHSQKNSYTPEKLRQFKWASRNGTVTIVQAGDMPIEEVYAWYLVYDDELPIELEKENVVYKAVLSLEDVIYFDDTDDTYRIIALYENLKDIKIIRK